MHLFRVNLNHTTTNLVILNRGDKCSSLSCSSNGRCGSSSTKTFANIEQVCINIRTQRTAPDQFHRDFIPGFIQRAVPFLIFSCFSQISTFKFNLIQLHCCSLLPASYLGQVWPLYLHFCTTQYLWLTPVGYVTSRKLSRIRISKPGCKANTPGGADSSHDNSVKDPQGHTA